MRLRRLADPPRTALPRGGASGAPCLFLALEAFGGARAPASRAVVVRGPLGLRRERWRQKRRFSDRVSDGISDGGRRAPVPLAPAVTRQKDAEGGAHGSGSSHCPSVYSLFAKTPQSPSVLTLPAGRRAIPTPPRARAREKAPAGSRTRESPPAQTNHQKHPLSTSSSTRPRSSRGAPSSWCAAP